MAYYTRPASNAADLAWTGLSAYTRPSSSGADLSLVQGSTYNVVTFGVVTNFGTPAACWDQFSDATGFMPTQFGTPTALLSQPVTGFSTTQFGTPAGYKLQRAQGFAPAQFGSPYLHPPHVAPWPISTQFGTPAAQQYWEVPSLGAVSEFGTPTTPTNRTATASGLAPVRLGRPMATQRTTSGLGIICRPVGFTTAAPGAPVARWAQYGTALPTAPDVHFGAPGSSTVHHTDSIPPARLGEPTSRRTQRATGFGLAVLGVPAATLTQHATGTAPKARFGAPKTVRSNWYEVRGFCPFRAGTPRGYQRNNHWASGFGGVQLGSPSAREARRVSSTPPACRLGVPLLRRNTQC